MSSCRNTELHNVLHTITKINEFAFF